MVRIEEVFLELFQTAQEYVSDADHLELCSKMLHVLSEHGFDVEILQGDDDIVDQALEEVLEQYDNYDEEEYE